MAIREIKIRFMLMCQNRLNPLSRMRERILYVEWLLLHVRIKVVGWRNKCFFDYAW